MAEVSTLPAAPSTAPARPRWRRALLATALMITMTLGAWVQWADWPGYESDEPPARADVIVVLGGGAQERPTQALRLYSEGRAGRVIVTGDGDKIIRVLREDGIPETALIHETASTSTIENARNVAPILAELGARSAILVTTWSHVHRARRIFGREVPGLQLYFSTEPRPPQLNKWERYYQRRERLASVHHLLVHGLWCF